jgi:serine/threonine-protein kinase
MTAVWRSCDSLTVRFTCPYKNERQAADVHSRIFVGVAAWLLGAATATGGSLLAVSLLGQGITGTGGQVRTLDQVDRALASEAATSSAAASTPAAPSRSATPSGTQSGLGSASPAPSASMTTSSVPPAPTPAGSSPAQSTAPPSGGAGPTAVVLTSQGGEVVASCLAAGAYLNSWSPVSGYEVGNVRRGPAVTARVTFESLTQAVTMVVSCSSGVPTATTTSGHDT